MALMRSATYQKIIDGVEAARRSYPDGVLVKNAVGNLAVMLNDEYVGFIDLATGRFNNIGR